MGLIRSNKAALFAAAGFFTFFLILAHFQLGGAPHARISDSDQFISDDSEPIPHKGIFVTANDDYPAAATLAVDVEQVQEQPSNVAAAAPTQIPQEKPAEAPASPLPTTANLDLFTPQQWVQPSVNPDSAEFPIYGAFPVKLPANDTPYWTEKLGKKLCIVDLESRPFSKPGYLWAPEGMSWSRSKDVHGPSGGTLNHWVYSKIHGYEYYYVHINSYRDRRDSWKKPSVLAKILKKHDVCVFIDSDALFNRLDLPMEWLMNYWSITPQNNSMALAFDPDTKHNYDRHGKIFLNTGFMIMQNKNRTYEIFKDWDDCANDGGKHPDCVEFRNRKGWQPTDQGGFGTFIRYDYPDDIKELDCNEANGFPESNSGCNGKFIKHVWLGKENRLKIAVGDVFPGVLLETFHKQFLREKDSFFTTEDALMAEG
ncbi:hypothetical protein FALBO_15780 [Fusarium albosuccineum]|uniref:Nucleotide-diphospho-sugar transferase domain-containing protein n=1 Tax=Fusarium albosuccineum TaxID=1237068 RepID=A0A8H4KS73_9HYPO|nr:hypothetical protein FALBO_15780 [Fusarium albosuccineum]